MASNKINFLTILKVLSTALLAWPCRSFAAKPVIKINYLAEYNKLTKPKNYDPNENAAFLYQKAFEAFVEMPEAIKQKANQSPIDLNDSEIATLRNWLNSNAECFEYFSKAVKKPYYWVERHAKDNDKAELDYPELDSIRKLNYTVAWQAKLEVFDGKSIAAFENLFDLYMMGAHLSGNKALMDQLTGLAICGSSFKTTFSILTEHKIDPDKLAFLQRKFEKELLDRRYEVNYSKAELLFAFDCIQRVFTDDGNGNGKLIPGAYAEETKSSVKAEDGSSLAVSYSKALLISLTHPDRKETTELAEKLYKQLNCLCKHTPWKLHEKKTTYIKEINNMTKGNYFFNHGSSSMGLVFELEYRYKAHADAIISTIAVLRYKADKDQLPQQLDELISAGYLQNLPMDPYSDKPLVYKKTEDNFILYSVGANFKDDGGVHSDNWEENDHIFWPVQLSQ